MQQQLITPELIALAERFDLEVRGPLLAACAERAAALNADDVASALLTEAAACFDATGRPEMRDRCLIDSAWLAARDGRPLDGEQVLQRVDEQALGPDLAPRYWMALGCVHAMLHEGEESSAAFEKAMSLYARMEQRSAADLLDQLSCMQNALIFKPEPKAEDIAALDEIAQQLARAGYAARSLECRANAIDLLLRRAAHAHRRGETGTARTLSREAEERAAALLEDLGPSRSASHDRLRDEVELRRAAALRGCNRLQEAAHAYASLVERLEASGRFLPLAIAANAMAKLAEAPGMPTAGVPYDWYLRSAEALEGAIESVGADELRTEALRGEIPDPYSALCRLLVDRHGVHTHSGIRLWKGSPGIEQVLDLSEKGRSAAFRVELASGGPHPASNTFASLSPADVLACLEDDEALLGFVLADPDEAGAGLVCYGADRRGVHWASHDRRAAQRVRGLVESLREHVAAAERGSWPDDTPWIEDSWDDIVRRLGKELLSTAVHESPEWFMGRKRRLVIVPYGFLHDVPFAALVVPDDRGGYLVERASLIVDPQASVRGCIRKRERGLQASGTLAITSAGHDDLVYRGEVLRALESACPPGRPPTIRHGLDADVDRPPSLLLLYGHGEFRADDPRSTALTFVRPDGTVERVTAEALLASPLRTDVTIAAACESARGRIAAGEALLGFRRAALAVSRCTVSTLWRVWELPMSEIVAAALRGMGAGASAASALREAQLGLLRGQPERRSYDPAHPYYWSGVIASGDPAARWRP